MSAVPRRLSERDFCDDATAASHNEPLVAYTCVLHLVLIWCWPRLAFTLARLAWLLAITVTTVAFALLGQSKPHALSKYIIGAKHHQDGCAMVAQVGGYSFDVCASVQAGVDGGYVPDWYHLGGGEGSVGLSVPRSRRGW